MRLSELYTSIQGEGPHTGKPIQFVRFGGCNLRCPGWPCDTQFAIDPKFKNNWTSFKPSELVERVEAWPLHICITGGEPLTQPRADLEEFVKLLGDYKIDLFTNGTRVLPTWAFEFRTSVVMDWKLRGSGETFEGSVESLREANVKQLKPKDGVKFVIKDWEDFSEACEMSSWFRKWNVLCPIWAGVAWGHLREADLVSWILREGLDWRLNVQQHNFIWSPQERGR